jgi:hypothetical protein
MRLRRAIDNAVGTRAFGAAISSGEGSQRKHSVGCSIQNELPIAMRVGASFGFPPHVSEAAVRTMASDQTRGSAPSPPLAGQALGYYYFEDDRGRRVTAGPAKVSGSKSAIQRVERLA